MHRVDPEYDLTNPATMENPYPLYRALHANNWRVLPVPEVGFWIGRMADIKEIARNTEIFSNNYFQEGAPIPTGVSEEPLEDDVKAIFAEGPDVVNALWTSDPPVHTGHRKLVNKAFTGQWVRSMEPAIRAIAHHLIDGFIARGETDFMHEYAVYLPMIVIAEALGMDRADAGKFKIWSDDILAGNLDVLDHDGRLRVARSFVDANNHFGGILNDRRSCPQSDLISRLATAEVEGHRLQNCEALPIINTLMLAGNETTTNLIGNAMRILIDRPDLMDILISDKSQIQAFLDEVMRYDGPVQCLYRIVTQDTVFADTELPAGTRIMLGWGSAGWDPEVFAQPEKFVMGRPNADKHVGFGFGPHICVGLGLARAEARIAIEAILERLCDIRFAPHVDLQHVPTFATRGYKSLHLQFKARA